jgi:hypothetical protein
VEPLTKAHAAVLDAVGDGAAALWELPVGSKYFGSGGSLVREVHAVPREEARRALRDLIAAGAVEIYEEPNDGSRQLSGDEIEAAISDDANWRPPADSGRPVWYGVALTESGESVYRDAAQTFGWE